eukprot:g10473.t1
MKVFLGYVTDPEFPSEAALVDIGSTPTSSEEVQAGKSNETYEKVQELVVDLVLSRGFFRHGDNPEGCRYTYSFELRHRNATSGFRRNVLHWPKMIAEYDEEHADDHIHVDVEGPLVAFDTAAQGILAARANGGSRALIAGSGANPEDMLSFAFWSQRCATDVVQRQILNLRTRLEVGVVAEHNRDDPANMRPHQRPEKEAKAAESAREGGQSRSLRRNSGVLGDLFMKKVVLVPVSEAKTCVDVVDEGRNAYENNLNPGDEYRGTIQRADDAEAPGDSEEGAEADEEDGVAPAALVLPLLYLAEDILAFRVQIKRVSGERSPDHGHRHKHSPHFHPKTSEEREKAEQDYKDRHGDLDWENTTFSYRQDQSWIVRALNSTDVAVAPSKSPRVEAKLSGQLQALLPEDGRRMILTYDLLSSCKTPGTGALHPKIAAAAIGKQMIARDAANAKSQTAPPSGSDERSPTASDVGSSRTSSPATRSPSNYIPAIASPSREHLTFVYLNWGSVVREDDSTYHRDEVLQFLLTFLKPATSDHGHHVVDEKVDQKVLILDGLSTACMLNPPAQDRGSDWKQKQLEALFAGGQLLEDLLELVQNENESAASMDWMLPLRAALTSSSRTTSTSLSGAGAAKHAPLGSSLTGGKSTPLGASKMVPWKSHLKHVDMWQVLQKHQHEECVLGKLGVYVVGVGVRGKPIASAWREFLKDVTLHLPASKQKQRDGDTTADASRRSNVVTFEKVLSLLEAANAGSTKAQPEEENDQRPGAVSAAITSAHFVVGETASQTLLRSLGSETDVILTSSADILSSTSRGGRATCTSNESASAESSPEKRSAAAPKQEFKIIGCLEQRKAMADAILWPRFAPEHFEAMALDSDAPSAVLICGPSGSGKTHLCEWVAQWLAIGLAENEKNRISCVGEGAAAGEKDRTKNDNPVTPIVPPVRTIFPSDLISPYVGESEENLRKVFNARRPPTNKSKTTAAASSDEILLFENVDQWLARDDDDDGDGATSSVHNRLLTTFLVLLDGIEKVRGAGRKVILCTSTKPASTFPPAVLRPGRLKAIPELQLFGSSDARSEKQQLNLKQSS